jgi:CubicO group peptidase (beta-lactamase class C family)
MGVSPGRASEPFARRIAAALDGLLGRYGRRDGPGAIVAVTQGEDLIYLNSAGYANREFRQPWTSDTRYTFFSLTKSMTALAVLALEKDGRLGLDDDIRRHLPDFPSYEYPISIRHLITHTSSLREDETLIHLLGTAAAYEPISADELYEMAKKQRTLAQRPGSSYYYNDTGMRIAARIVAKTAGSTFADAMSRLVFGPAKMHTAYISTREPRMVPKRATTYLKPDPGVDVAVGPLETAPLIVETTGDGAACGTILDLVAYLRYLRQDNGLGQRRIDRLTEPVHYRPGVVGPYRTCMRMSETNGVRIARHGGLYGKVLGFLVDHDIGFAMMRNMEDETSWASDFVGEIVAALPAGADAGKRVRKPTPRLLPEGSLGTWIEPRDGYVVRLHNEPTGPRVSLLGLRADLVATGNDFRAAEDADLQISVRLDESRPRIVFADWSEARNLDRPVIAGMTHAAALTKYAGLYRSPEYGAVYNVFVKDSALKIEIGAGVRRSERYDLVMVSDGIFEAVPEGRASYLALEFLAVFRGTGDASMQLIISTFDVRGLSAVRMNCGSPDSNQQ